MLLVIVHMGYSHQSVNPAGVGSMLLVTVHMGYSRQSVEFAEVKNIQQAIVHINSNHVLARAKGSLEHCFTG